MGYGDYLEQLTYLIFLKMVDEVTCTTLDADTKGNIYEGIREKNAEDTKPGTGQYFTPRALIKAMVACVAPPLPARARLSRSSSVRSAPPWFNSGGATAAHRPFNRSSATRASLASGCVRSPASRCAIASASRPSVSARISPSARCAGA